jgi:hypothetical protein
VHHRRGGGGFCVFLTGVFETTRHQIRPPALNTYGSSLPSPTANLSKRAESAESRLQERAFEIGDANPAWPLEKCLRQARLEQPYLYQAMNT